MQKAIDTATLVAIALLEIPFVLAGWEELPWVAAGAMGLWIAVALLLVFGSERTRRGASIAVVAIAVGHLAFLGYALLSSGWAFIGVLLLAPFRVGQLVLASTLAYRGAVASREVGMAGGS